MVLPASVDPQVFPRVALFVEAGFEQQPPTRLVTGQAGGLDPVQAEALEGILEHRPERFGRVTMAGVDGADPVAERRGLGYAAAQIGKRHAAEQDVVRGPENQETVGHSLAHLGAVQLEPAAERTALGGPGCLGTIFYNF